MKLVEHAFLVIFHVVVAMEVGLTNVLVATLILIAYRAEASVFVLKVFGRIPNQTLSIANFVIQIVVHVQVLRTLNALLVGQEESETLITFVCVIIILSQTQVEDASAPHLIFFPKENVLKVQTIHVVLIK